MCQEILHYIKSSISKSRRLCGIDLRLYAKPISSSDPCTGSVLPETTLGQHFLYSQFENKYIYHEGLAHKSPDEVCTFLLNYFQNDLPPSVKKLLLFSDGAAGQNKNNTLVRFLLCLRDNGRFESIKHFFPVRGHSFLPCDHEFGTIKQVLRKVDRIYTPAQYGETNKHSE